MQVLRVLAACCRSYSRLTPNLRARHAGVLALAAVASLALLSLGDISASRAGLLQFVPMHSLSDGEIVYQPQRARISFLPIRFLEMQYPPTYNNHKLREAGCFGFDRNPGPPNDYQNWFAVFTYLKIFTLLPVYAGM